MAAGTRVIVIRAMVGSAVHVREDDTCRAGVVLAVGPLGDRDNRGSSPSYVLIRVSRPTSRGITVGIEDSEGWFWHHNDAVTVDRPGGGTRTLDAWHFPDDHDPDCSRFGRGVESSHGS